MLAIGTDGEKALVDGFRKNFRFSIFLRCFIHFRANNKTELSNRGLSITSFVEDIFGKQDGDTKNLGLVDCESIEEFDQKLASLKNEWLKRDTRKKGLTFYEWF